jgi:hypothetical protein
MMMIEFHSSVKTEGAAAVACSALLRLSEKVGMVG